MTSTPIRTLLISTLAASLRDAVVKVGEDQGLTLDPNMPDLEDVASEILDAISPRSLELLAERGREQRAEEYSHAQAALTDPAARKLVQQMRDQLLIVLIGRAGGKVGVSVDEVDATGDRYLSMEIDGRTFNFTVVKKN